MPTTMSPTMPSSKTYTGGCHLRTVRFECTHRHGHGDRLQLLDLHQEGPAFTFLAPQSFQLRAGDDNLREYLFNKHAIRHQLCIDCGVDVFARGKKPDGTGRGGAQRRCIDGVDLSKLKMTRWTAGAGDEYTLLVMAGLAQA